MKLRKAIDKARQARAEARPEVKPFTPSGLEPPARGGVTKTRPRKVPELETIPNMPESLESLESLESMEPPDISETWDTKLAESPEASFPLMRKTSPPAMREKGRAPAVAERAWLSPVYGQPRYVEIDPGRAYENRCVCISQNAPEIEAYKMLKARIQQRVIAGKGWNTFMITSALHGEGKTLTSINLALRFAKSLDQTVLLVDCDLRRQKIHEYLGYPSDKGLIDYLAENAPFNSLIHWAWGIGNLSLISGGKPPVDSTDLIDSPRMRTLLDEMRNRFSDRIIFFDAPPVLTTADAMTLASLVDGIILVVESGRTDIRDVRKADESLPAEKIVDSFSTGTEVEAFDEMKTI